jgi:hypothetical protein
MLSAMQLLAVLLAADVGATDDDLATDFSAFENTETDSSVVGGYDEAGLNVLTTENDKDTEVLDSTDITDTSSLEGVLEASGEIVFNEDGTVSTGNGDTYDTANEAIDAVINGSGTDGWAIRSHFRVEKF